MPVTDLTTPAPERADRRDGLRPFDRRLLGRAAGVRWVLAVDVAAALTTTLLLLAQVSLIATIVADVVAGRGTGVAAPLAAALVAVVLGRAGLAQVVEVSGRAAANRVMSALRTELVTRRLRHGGADLDGIGSGELAAASVQGVDGLETYFARYLPQVALAVTVPVAVLLVSAFTDLQSALIMLVTLPLIPVFMVLIGRSAGLRARRNWQALAQLSAHFLDVVRGLPTLRAFNRGRSQIPKIAETTDQYRRATMGTLRLAFLSGLVLDLATTLSTALVAVTLGVRLVDGSVGLRTALIVLLLVPELYAPIRSVGSQFHASSDGLAAAERILGILEPGDTDQPGASDQLGASGQPGASGGHDHGARPPFADPALHAVELQGVTVQFAGRPVPSLDRIDLRLERRELLAVAGPSGAGKTTLARVLLGLIRPDQGAVVVDGRVLTDADLGLWRHHLAWAPQRPAIVHGTVAANIALGQVNHRQAEIEAAAKQAGAHEFIRALPDGYDTLIGSGGRGLSAGQRQRIGLARALLRDAPLLVLDEPSAHLDAVARQVVAATLHEMHGSRTIVVLTHDDDLGAGADRVVRLDHGRVAHRWVAS